MTNKNKLKLLFMFATIMAASFIPENYHTLFGDWLCQGSGEYIVIGEWGGGHYAKCNQGMSNAFSNSFHTPTWHWGFRHYIWVALGLTFLIINIYELTKAENEQR